MSPQEQKEIAKLADQISQAKKVWSPLPGPQTLAFFSKADILFYGGAAGGGKTDLLIGIAYHNHYSSVIYRLEHPQLDDMIERSREIFDGEISYGNYNENKKRWNFKKGNRLKFDAVDNKHKSHKKRMGRARDLICFDEITHFTRETFEFPQAWLRSAIPGQRCRVIATGNPPLQPEERWVVKYFAPWLDPRHPNPAKPGELRWFANIGDREDVECESGDPFEHIAEDGKKTIIKPLSRTFIPALVTDNPHYANSDYLAKLESMREPMRSRMRYGLFNLEDDDPANQLIPTSWVRAAMDRWHTRKPEGNMDSLGVDVARGGKDRNVLSPRYGNYFAEQKPYPGSETRDGSYLAQIILKVMQKETQVNIDAAGVGSSPYDFLKSEVLNLFAIDSAAKSRKTDRSGRNRFINKRAEMYWLFMEMLDPAAKMDIALPDDPELLADLCVVKYKLTVRGIQVQSKDEIKDIIGRSPDKGDSCVYASVLDTGPRLRELD